MTQAAAESFAAAVECVPLNSRRRTHPAVLGGGAGLFITSLVISSLAVSSSAMAQATAPASTSTPPPASAPASEAPAAAADSAANGDAKAAGGTDTAATTPASLGPETPEIPKSAFYGIDEWPDTGLTPGESATSATNELEEMYMPHFGTLDLGKAEYPLDWLTRELTRLEAETGLRFGMAYTMLFQQASGGPGRRYGASGDLDLMTSWTLLGRGTKDTGRFIFTGEYRHAIGPQPASRLGGVLGTLTNTTGGFNDRGWVVRDAYWLQSLLDNRLRFLVGRADPSDFVGGHRLQGINGFFSNRAFSANAATAFPGGHGPTAGVSIVPTDLFYVTVGASNGYSQPTTWNVESLFDNWDLFSYGEIGLTPEIEGLGPGRYRVMLWYADSRPEDGIGHDKGFSLILEQDLGDTFQAFVRYSHSMGEITNIANTVQGGVGIRGLLGSRQNLTGLAASWSEPDTGGGPDEKVVELFHRWQLTRHTQFSVGVQGIFDPTNNATQDDLAVFTARFRLAF